MHHATGRIAILGLVTLALTAPDLGWAQTTPVASNARPAHTTTSDLDDVRLFQAWMMDSPVTPGFDLEPFFDWDNDDNFNVVSGGARAALWITDAIEAGGQLSFSNLSPAFGDGQSGINDIMAYGRYKLGIADDRLEVSLGATADLPVGKAEVGGETFDFTFFAAGRAHLSNGIDVTANVGIESRETPALDTRENGLLVGAGAIIPMTSEVATVVELQVGTALDYMAASGGLDYELPPGGHLRGALVLGLDNGAPDFGVQFALALPVY